MGSVSTATIRFYADLNDFLAPGDRQRDLSYSFSERVSIKDALESHGVPHTEIDLLLVNGVSAPFTYNLQDGDRASAYPRFRRLDVSAETVVRPPSPLGQRFVLDGHLGRLAAYLRMAGFDVRHDHEVSDKELASISAREDRILLTRDIALLRHGIVRHGYYVRETAPRRQAFEVFCRFDLARLARPFERCLRCNELVRQVPKAEVEDRVPPRSRSRFSRFFRCSGCGRIYWEGSHYRWMRTFMDALLEGTRRD
jgi:uncharacterized protein